MSPKRLQEWGRTRFEADPIRFRQQLAYVLNVARQSDKNREAFENAQKAACQRFVDERRRELEVQEAQLLREMGQCMNTRQQQQLQHHRG